MRRSRRNRREPARKFLGKNFGRAVASPLSWNLVCFPCTRIDFAWVWFWECFRKEIKKSPRRRTTAPGRFELRCFLQAAFCRAHEKSRPNQTAFIFEPPQGSNHQYFRKRTKRNTVTLRVPPFSSSSVTSARSLDAASTVTPFAFSRSVTAKAKVNSPWQSTAAGFCMRMRTLLRFLFIHTQKFASMQDKL